MNRKDKSPADPIDPTEGLAEPDRLAEIEQRLKRVRPQPPRCDAVTLAERAWAAANGSVDAAPRGVGRRRTVGRMAVMAGVWVCGAAVGAAAMFVVLANRGQPAGERGMPVVEGSNPAPQTVVDAAAPAVASDPPRGGLAENMSPLKPAAPRDDQTALWAALAEPFESQRALDGPNRRVLRAGTHLSAQDASADEPLLELAAAPRDAPLPSAEANRAAPRDYVPPGEVTREQLLEDILREMNGMSL